jgi:uncharacterized protein (DUF1778 family)
MATAAARAREVLAEHRWFVTDDAAWAEFSTVPDPPVSRNTRLAEAFAEQPIFDTPD